MSSTLNKWWVLIGTGIAGLIIAIDFTVVNTSLANIQTSLNSSVSTLQWLMTGFGITFSAFLVTLGRLGDILGRRKIFYICVVGFGLASLGAGLAPNMTFLIAMRILQGFFGAAIFPCGMAITGQAFPAEQQGRALGIYGSILGAGLAIGPVLGSVIVTLLGWRWIFLINIPIIIISLAICFFVVKESRLETKEPIDWMGVFLVVAFLASLVFGISEGQQYGWTSPLILSALGIAVLSLIALIIIEPRKKDPLIPFDLFANRGFGLGLIVYVASVSVSWPVLFFMPLYLHNVIGFDTGIVGLLLAVMTIMTIVMPALSGHLFDSRFRKLTIHSVFFFALLGLVGFILLSVSGPLWLILLSFVLFGIAWGVGNGIGMPLSLSSASGNEHAGLISGAVITLLNTFAVIFLSLSTLLFGIREKAILFGKLATQQVSLDPAHVRVIQNFLSTPEKAAQILKSFSQEVIEKIIHAFHQAFVGGMHFVFTIFLIIVAALWLVTLILLRKPLSK